MIRLAHLQADKFKQLREVEINFPARFCALVEGPNEAGKSTLFEAIYFALYGKGLAMRGGGGGQMASLIVHGNENASAMVQLGLRVHDTDLKITRKIGGTRNQAEVVISSPDGEECVRGIRDVNNEILSRLSYLDGEALLSSCFVQQKKLGRLEDLNSAERKNILFKLLDMERLNRLKESFKWSDTDKCKLQTAQQKRRLAQISQDLVAVRSALEQVERHLVMAGIHAALEALTIQSKTARLAREKAAVHQAASERLAAEIARVEAFDKAISLLDRIIREREEIASRERDQEQLVAEIERIRQLERETLPRLESQTAQLKMLAERIEQAASLESARQEMINRAGRIVEILHRAESLAAPREELAHLESESKSAALREQQAHNRLELARRVKSLREETARLDLEIRQGEEQRARLRKTLSRAEALNERRIEAETLSRELKAAEESEAVARSQLETATRVEELRKLLKEMEAEISAVAQRQARLAQLNEQARELTKLRAAQANADEKLVTARERLAEAEKSYRYLEQSQALRGWVAARRDADLRAQIGQTLAAKKAKAEAARLRQRQAEERQRAGQRALMIGAGTLAAGLALTITGLFTTLPLIAAGFTLALIGFGVARRGKRRSNRATAERQAAESEATQFEREAHGEEVRRDTLLNQQPLDLAAARRRLAAFELSEPISVEEAERQATTLSDTSQEEISSAVNQERERVQQLERAAFESRQRFHLEEENLERELKRAGLQRVGQIANAMETAQEEQSEAQRRYDEAQDEITSMSDLLPLHWEIKKLSEALSDCVNRWQEKKIELARVEEAISAEEDLVRATLPSEGVQDEEAARGLIERIEERVHDLSSRREARVDESAHLANDLPGDLSVSDLEAQANQASNLARRIEMEVGERRAQVRVEEERISRDLKAEKLAGLENARRVLAQLEADERKMATQISEAWQADHELLRRWTIPEDTSEARVRLTKLQADLGSEITRAREQIEKRSAYEAESSRKAQEIKLRARNIEAWQRELTTVAQDAHLPGDLASRVVDAASEFRFLSELQLQRSQRDPNKLKQAYQEEIASKAAEATKARQAEDMVQQHLTTVRCLLAKLGVEELEEINAEIINRQLTDFTRVKASDQIPLQAQRDDLLAQKRGLENEAEQLELTLHTKRGQLNYQECERELKTLLQRQTICGYAGPILDQVRDNILQAILPSTLNYMCKMLPQLTCGRYIDATLDEETYKIHVYDNRARAYMEKDIFSGATQDQFSLALRLAFALATLPEELGAQPKFIFLDEPTAGFDGERREAFINLLTRGDLAQRFDQIFLASPEGVFSTNPLPHLLQINGGRIVKETISPAST